MRRVLFLAACVVGGCFSSLTAIANGQTYPERWAPRPTAGSNGYVYQAPAYYARPPSYAFWGFPNYTTYQPQGSTPIGVSLGGGYGNRAYGSPAYGNPTYGNPAFAYPAYGYPAYGSSGNGYAGYYGGFGPGPTEFLRFGGADFYGW